MYGNYGGDRMNFDMAAEMVELEDIETATVLGTDDIASATPDETARRRGVAGIVYAYKAAVAEAARNAVERTRTIGVGLAPCHVPGASRRSFSVADDELEFGIGIHGEPGIWRDKLRPANTLVKEMVCRLLAERPADHSGRVSILVNSLGATPLDELFILYRKAAALLEAHGLTIVQPLVGHFVTSMEMAGASVSFASWTTLWSRCLLRPPGARSEGRLMDFTVADLAVVAQRAHESMTALEQELNRADSRLGEATRVQCWRG